MEYAYFHVNKFEDPNRVDGKLYRDRAAHAELLLTTSNFENVGSSGGHMLIGGKNYPTVNALLAKKDEASTSDERRIGIIATSLDNEVLAMWGTVNFKLGKITLQTSDDRGFAFLANPK